MMTDQQLQDFEDMSVAFSMDALDADERDAFLSMLRAASPEQKRLHATNMAVSHSLARSLPIQEPEARVKKQILQQILAQQERAAEPARPVEVVKPSGFAGLLGKLGFDVPEVGFIWAAGSIAAMALVVFFGWEFKQETASYKQMAEQTRLEYEALVADSKADNRIIALLQNPSVQMAALAGKEVNPQGVGQIVWDPETREGFLRFANLPKEAADKDYQLWFIDEGGPQSAGVFSVQGDSGIVWLSSLPDIAPANIAAFGVTLEPEGGVDAPTGDMYLLGTPG